MTLLQMSLSGALMILTVALIRALAMHRLPKRLFPALWGVVLARLLIPFSLPSPLSLFRLLRPATDVAPIANQTTVPVAETVAAWTAMPTGGAATIADAAAEVAIDVVPDVAARGFAPSGVDPWLTAWLIGLALAALYFLIGYVLHRRRFRESLPVSCEFVRAWLAAHPLRRRVQARQTDRIAAPLTYGVLRPVILLPSRTDWADEGVLDYVLAHEWTHIRRFDALFKPLLIAAACVHWFNPLAWAMLALANRDLELACDEQVVLSRGRDSRRSYALALIRIEERRHGPSPLYSHFSRTAIEERITAIMKTGNRSRIATALALLWMLSAFTAFATSAPQPERAQLSAASESGELRLDRAEYDAIFARYEPFGLRYGESDGRLYYLGQRVRYFEDMYPVDLDCFAGVALDWDDGEIDVYAVRDLTAPIQRNADGSYDPSGTLTGLRIGTAEEIEARARKRSETAFFQTSAPDGQASIASESGELRLDRAEYDATYARYEPFGLRYGESDGRLYYLGQRVRYFEDMYPSSSSAASGTVCQFPDGEVDVRAVRDLTAPIQRNADGTFDPSGTLTGLEAFSEEEFARHTPMKLWTQGADGEMREETLWLSHFVGADFIDSAASAVPDGGEAPESVMTLASDEVLTAPIPTSLAGSDSFDEPLPTPIPTFLSGSDSFDEPLPTLIPTSLAGSDSFDEPLPTPIPTGISDGEADDAPLPTPTAALDGASDAGLAVACRPGESVGYADHGTVRIDVEATEHGSYFFLLTVSSADDAEHQVRVDPLAPLFPQGLTFSVGPGAWQSAFYLGDLDAEPLPLMLRSSGGGWDFWPTLCRVHWLDDLSADLSGNVGGAYAVSIPEDTAMRFTYRATDGSAVALYSDAAPEWQPVIRPEDGALEADVTLTVPAGNLIIRFLGNGLLSRR